MPVEAYHKRETLSEPPICCITRILYIFDCFQNTEGRRPIDLSITWAMPTTSWDTRLSHQKNHSGGVRKPFYCMWIIQRAKILSWVARSATYVVRGSHAIATCPDSSTAIEDDHTETGRKCIHAQGSTTGRQKPDNRYITSTTIRRPQWRGMGSEHRRRREGEKPKENIRW